MKLLIATPYFHPEVGGLENYVEQIAKQLVERGWEVHIATSGDRTTTEEWNGMTVHRLRTWFVLSNTPVSLAWVWQLRRIMSDIRPDVVNVHAPVPSIGLAMAAACGNTPLVVTYHAGSMKKGRPLVDLLIAAYENVLLPHMLNRANYIICASDFVRKNYLARWKSKSVTVTPGVDTDAFKPSPMKRVPGRVVFVGNHTDPRKGLDVLLDAMKQLPKATLRVVGSGTPGGQERVNYLGVKQGEALTREIGSAQVLVLPSVTEAEAFGTVLIEGMACGVAVIGSDVGGIGGVIDEDENGYLVPAGYADALAAAIKKLLDDPDLARELGWAGRRKAVKKYAWKTLAADTESILLHAVHHRMAGQTSQTKKAMRHTS